MSEGEGYAEYCRNERLEDVEVAHRNGTCEPWCPWCEGTLTDETEALGYDERDRIDELFS